MKSYIELKDKISELETKKERLKVEFNEEHGADIEIARLEGGIEQLQWFAQMEVAIPEYLFSEKSK